MSSTAIVPSGHNARRWPLSRWFRSTEPTAHELYLEALHRIAEHHVRDLRFVDLIAEQHPDVQRLVVRLWNQTHDDELAPFRPQEDS